MNLDQLVATAKAMVAPGKGILAADESTTTIRSRFDAIGVESTPDSRRDYRELLFRSEKAMKEHISGVMSGCTISGAFTLEEARRLRDVLNCGTLPAPVKIIQRSVVGSTLGQDAIDSGIRAAVVGSILVCFFMLF